MLFLDHAIDNRVLHNNQRYSGHIHRRLRQVLSEHVHKDRLRHHSGGSNSDQHIRHLLFSAVHHFRGLSRDERNRVVYDSATERVRPPQRQRQRR